MPKHRPVALVAAAAALTLLSACSSKESRIESGLEKASTFVRSSDWDKASVEVRNVLQIEPKTARAQYIAGQIAEAKLDLRRAYGHYTKAIELQPGYADAQVGAARLLLFTGDLDRAETGIRDVLAADATHVGARALQAALAARRGQTDEARAAAQRLVDEVKPVPVEAVMLLAGLHANDDRATDALALVDKALAVHPGHVGLLQIGAQIAAAGRDAQASERAAGYLRRATAATPKNLDLWRGWASMHLARGEVDAAEKVLRDAVAADQRDPARETLLLEFLARQRTPDVAEKAYLAAIDESPKEAALRFGLADLYGASNRAQDARRVLAEIIEMSEEAPAGLTARNRLATYELAAGRVAQARALVDAVLKANPRDTDALYLRGRMHLRDGNARDAIVDLRAVAKDRPGAADVVALLAQAHRAAGEPRLAGDVVAEAVKLRPQDPALRLQMAVEHADVGDLPAATAQVDEAIRLAPQLVRAYQLKARLALARKDEAGAENAYRALKAALPGQPLGHVELGKFLADRGRYDAALKEYDEAAAARPRDALPYLATVGLLVGTKRYDQALARIDRREKVDPDNVMHQQLRGDVALARGDLAAAERAYREAIRVAPTLPVGYVHTARTLARRNDLAGAVAVLEQGEKAVPGDASLPLARAEWLTRAQRHDEAIAAYEGLLERNPDNDVVANNLAFLLAEAKGDRASVERALALAGRFAESRDAAQLDSLGWIHYKLGDYAKAVPLLERAVARAPASPLLQLHLGKALVKAGDGARGKEWLRKAIDSRQNLPNLDEARAMLAQG